MSSTTSYDDDVSTVSGDYIDFMRKRYGPLAEKMKRRRVKISDTASELAYTWFLIHCHANGGGGLGNCKTSFKKWGFSTEFGSEYGFQGVEGAAPSKPKLAWDFEDHYVNEETAELRAKKYFKKLRHHIDLAFLLIEETDGDFYRLEEKRWPLTVRFLSGQLRENITDEPSESQIKRFDGTKKMKKEGPYRTFQDYVDDITDIHTQLGRFHWHMRKVGEILENGEVEDVRAGVENLHIK